VLQDVIVKLGGIAVLVDHAFEIAAAVNILNRAASQVIRHGVALFEVTCVAVAFLFECDAAFCFKE